MLEQVIREPMITSSLAVNKDVAHIELVQEKKLSNVPLLENVP